MDGFRFYSLIGVVVLHLLIGSGVFAAASHTGQVVLWWVLGQVIDGFFIISGFGLFLGVVATRGRIEDVGNWAIRRAARILPAYWLALAVILVLIAIWPQEERGIVFPELREVGIHLVGFQFPMRVFDGSFPIGFNVAFPVWMLSIIICFYLVFPLISRSYYRHPFAGLAVAAAISIGWRELVLHEPAFFADIENGATPAFITQLMVTDQLPGWAFSFALGMTGAWLYHRYVTRSDGGPLVSARVGLAVFAAGLIAFAFFGYLFAEEIANRPASIGDTAARTNEPLLAEAHSASRALLMAGIVLAPVWLQAPFTNRPVQVGAELSYAVYLIHFPVALYVAGIWLGIDGDGSLGAFAALSAAVLIPSFAYAYLSNRLVERPATRWARRQTARDREHDEGIEAGSPAPP